MSESLDLSAYSTSLLYEADFSKPLSMVRESALAVGQERVKRPEGVAWVFEGNGEAWTEDGKLHISCQHGEFDHVVLWHVNSFPGDVLIDFEADIPAQGLAIVFFCTRNRQGGGIFEPGLPLRGGTFTTYHSGELDGYHVSYWAGPRGTANLRKNHGFAKVANGTDHIAAAGPGRHRVRILKVGKRIILETAGKISITWEDPDRPWGDGQIGLRQMRKSEYMRYHNLRIYRVDAK